MTCFLPLKSVDFTVPNDVIGKNTYDAIQSGVIFGHTSLIDGLIEKSLFSNIFIGTAFAPV